MGKGKHYSDGLDLSYMLGLGSIDAQLAFLKQVETLFYKILTFPMPTIAAINGHAFAGGFLLALAHDYRVMNSEKGFGCMTEIDIGSPLTPGFTQLLNRKLPVHVAGHMMVTAARLNAAELKAHGVVWSTAKADQVLPESVALAVKYAPKAKPAMREIKEDLYGDALRALRYTSALRPKL